MIHSSVIPSLRARGQAARIPRLLYSLTFLLFSTEAERLRAAEFSDLEPLIQEHCIECHGIKEPEGGLVLETYEGFLKGGESGPALIAGKGYESLLLKALEGDWGKTGKNQFMPPGKRAKLRPDQIALFRAWIDAGAPAPKSPAVPREIQVPRIAPKTTPRRPVQSLAFEPKSRLLVLARPDAVELVHAYSQSLVRSLTGFRGVANAVAVSADGQFVFAGAGDATGGEVIQWRLADGMKVRSLAGHPDAVYSLALSADGTTLASGGYDYSIRLWSVADGTALGVVSVNQGAIMGLAFRPDSLVLASAGFDRTAKLYASPSGNRLETFGQALKELNAVAFSPDGRTLITGGGDNRIRAYRIGPEGREGSNELTDTVFAHEGAILRLAYSPDGRTVASSSDDRTVKLLDAVTLRPRLTLEPQPDWPTALAFAGDAALVVGRADGSLGFYDVATAKPSALPRPELTRTQPRGVRRGTITRVQLIGRQLDRASVVRVFRGGHLWSASAPEWAEGSLGLTVEPPADEPLGAWEISVGDGGSESARVKLWVDDLRQTEVTAVESAQRIAEPARVEGPVSIWSALERPGTVTEFSIAGRQGQTLVFDLSAQRLGAKGDYTVTLINPAGATVGFNDSFAGQVDPTLIVPLLVDGAYRVRVSEVTFAGSPDHFFRLSCGELPFITGLFPSAIPVGRESRVRLLGGEPSR